MKKDYITPEFDLFKLNVTDVICDSRTEGGGGGGNWGPGEGEPNAD